MDTYLNCLLLLQEQGDTHIKDANGNTLPIECAIEHAMKWERDDSNEYFVENGRILRRMNVMIAEGEVA